MSQLVTQSMVPSQRHAVKNFPARGEFSLNDWEFDVFRAQEYNWRPGTFIQSDFNWFSKSEPYQSVKNSIFDNSNSETNPIYGHMVYELNPLQQEQTNSHAAAYNLQELSRINWNTNPAVVMKDPANRYPVNVPLNSYKGSNMRPRFN